jgi:hypothetical protein
MQSSWCNTCMARTTHTTVKSHERLVGIDNSEHTYHERWELIQCGGCGTISAHRLAWEIPDHVLEHFYPVRFVRRRPDWLAILPELQVPRGRLLPTIDLMPLQSLLRQTYEAHDNDLLVMTAMGVRAVLDMAMTHLVGDKSTFRAKLDACEQQGFLSASEQERLSTVIDAGNAAAHRGFAPTSGDVATMLGVMEHVVESAFVHPRSVADLNARTPKRR